MKLKDFDFRIWDNSTNKFIEFAISDNIRAIPRKNDDLMLELWTGYFDKNGNKIYEGDIIKYVYVFNHALLDKYMLKRLPKKVSIGYVGIDDFLGFRILKNKELQCFMKDVTNIEIIGNIHENAELLKEQDEAKRKGVENGRYTETTRN
ncbi:YopX family protein [Campylobacter upsaliensis]